MEKCKTIKYFIDYDIDNYKTENRKYSMAAKYKVDYIVSVLCELGYHVQIVSTAQTQNMRGIYKSRKIAINNDVDLVQSLSLGLGKSKIGKFIAYFFAKIWLVLWMLGNVKHGETYIVYHSVANNMIHCTINLLKRTHIVLELEELYYKFGFSSRRSEINEKKIILKAYKYILSNDSFKHEFSNINEYNSCVIHGAYQNFKSSKARNQWQLVYAGGIDSIREGAQNAIKLVSQLGYPYVLKIAGYGSEKDITLLCDLINNANINAKYKQVIFCGTLYGDALDELLWESSIALNIQNQHDYYMNYAFPSKVLAYLSHGLPIVSSRIETVEKSCFSNCISFIDINEGNDFKKLFERIRVDDEYIFELISELHFQFKNKLAALLK